VHRMKTITVITPTYNRCKTLHRVYNSLVSQTYKDFEWLVIDDGSTDDTKELIQNYIKENKIDIRYYSQENQGKHMALNKAMQLIDSEYITVIDSDDEFLPNAFEVFLKYWNEIEDKSLYKSVTCRSYNPISGQVEGTEIKNMSGYHDARTLDARIKEKNKGEKWSLDRACVFKEFPYPDLKGYNGESLHFIPEAIVFDAMSRKYYERFINEPLRGYYHDQENAITSRSSSRSNANYYLWRHTLNDILDYFFYDILYFIKAAVGITFDGIATGRSLKTILKELKLKRIKILVAVLSPMGYILNKIRKE